MFHVQTKGTCDDWCQDQGSTCVAAQDNRSECQRTGQGGTSCDQTFRDQICVCAPKSYKPTPAPTAHSSGFELADYKVYERKLTSKQVKRGLRYNDDLKEWPNGCHDAARDIATGNSMGRTLKVNVCDEYKGTDGFEWDGKSGTAKACGMSKGHATNWLSVATFGTFKRDKHACGQISCYEVTSSAKSKHADEQMAKKQALEQQDEPEKPEVKEVYHEEEEEMVDELIELLLMQIDMAANFYIAYKMITVLLSAPLELYKSGLAAKMRRGCCGVMGQPSFILLVVVFWNLYQYLVIPMADMDMDLYWANFLQDPCYIEPNFNLKKKRIVKDVCTELTDMEFQYKKAAYEIVDLDIDAQAYDICWPADYEDLDASESGFYEQYGKPFADAIGKYKPENFAGECDMNKEIKYFAQAPGAGSKTSFWAIFINSGLVAQLFIIWS